MLEMNLLEFLEVAELERRCQNFVIIGVLIEDEIGFLGQLVDLREVYIKGEQQNYFFTRIDDFQEPEMVDFLRQKRPDLVLLSTVFNQGVFYRVRQVIGKQILLIGFSIFGVDDEHKKILLEYADGIIERHKMIALILGQSLSKYPYFDWLLSQARRVEAMEERRRKC